MRSDGPVPVVLALDEMGVSEEFVGGAAAKILAIARSRGLWLLVACQHLEQLSESLRTSLLANTSVRAFFRLGHADARVIAASLAAGTGERVAKVAVDVGKRDAEGLPEAWAESSHTVRDGRGEPICLSPSAVQAFWHLARKAEGDTQIAGLKRLAAVSGIDRLYVHAADTKKPVELSRYVRGLPPEDYCLSGSGPVRLTVYFPRPRLSVLSRETETERERKWIKVLGELPVRQAVMRLASKGAQVVQVLPVADPVPAPGFERFLSAAVAASGQSAREVEQAQVWRRETAEQVAEETLPADHSHAERFTAQPGVPAKQGASPRATRSAAPQPGITSQVITKPPAASVACPSVQKGMAVKGMHENNTAAGEVPVMETIVIEPIAMETLAMETLAMETIAEDGSLA